MGKSVVNVDLLRERAFSLAKSQMFSAMALADCIESLHDAKAHEAAVKTDGTRFKSFAEYAEYRNPPGLGFNVNDGAANIESIVLRLMTADPNRPAIRYLGGKRSTGKPGAPEGNDNAKKGKTTGTAVPVVSGGHHRPKCLSESCTAPRNRIPICRPFRTDSVTQPHGGRTVPVDHHRGDRHDATTTTGARHHQGHQGRAGSAGDAEDRSDV